jgi:hypothetical protein
MEWGTQFQPGANIWTTGHTQGLDPLLNRIIAMLVTDFM